MYMLPIHSDVFEGIAEDWTSLYGLGDVGLTLARVVWVGRSRDRGIGTADLGVYGSEIFFCVRSQNRGKELARTHD
jgi:hypothetical protein